MHKHEQLGIISGLNSGSLIIVIYILEERLTCNIMIFIKPLSKNALIPFGECFCFRKNKKRVQVTKNSENFKKIKNF